MPRPRSSTFYLPLAPIDAPLELKAKLSVLPPSAANALLAPRNNHYNPQSNGGLPFHHGCSGVGFSRSTTNTNTSINTTSSNNGTGSGCSGTACTAVSQEDECTRLNRVLGIPTPSNQHTHITLPSNSPHPPPPPSTSTLHPPSNAPASAGGVGRRRHTDAPKPSFPLSSPLSPPTPVPAERTGTGYFSTSPPTWGTTTWGNTTRGNTGGKPGTSQLATPAPVMPLSERDSSSPGVPSISESDTASIPPHRVTPQAQEVTVQEGITNGNRDRDDNGRTEVGTAWTPAPADAQDRWNPVGHGVADMDVFARACEVQNPVVNRTVDSTRGSEAEGDLLWNSPSSSSVPTAFSISTASPTIAAASCPTTTAASRPTAVSRPTTASSPSRPTTAAPPTAAAAAPVQLRPPTRSPLSYIPCGMHHVLACRTKIPSRFAPSPLQSRGPSRPSTSRLCSSRPSSSSTSTSTSITSSSTSTTSTSNSTPSSSTNITSTSNSIVLTSKLVVRPPPCDSLHPNDTRHLLLPQFRLSFPPPPPPPLPTARDTHPREEVCMFVDESIPGLADINANFVSTTTGESSSDESTCASRQDRQFTSQLEPYYTSQATAAATKMAPRQRFRLAPSYLPRVLRRSLGATAWARAETLRAARAVERGFGWDLDSAIPLNFNTGATAPLNFNTGAGAWPLAFAALDSLAQGAQSSAWWESANGQSECSFGNSLVWSGYEDVYSEEADEDMDVDEVKEESIWDWDDEDVEPVLVQGLQRPCEEDRAMDEDEFVREGAPEPEERPSSSDYSPQSSPSYSLQTPVTPSESDVAGYSMVGKFGWDTAWPASPTSPVFPAGGEPTRFQSIDIPGLDVTPITLGLPPVHRRTVRREDGAEEEEEDEEIFRYSPLKVEEDQGRMDVEGDSAEQVHYLHTQSMSSCSTPTATSPSFPPAPLRGVAISSSFDDGYLVERINAGEQAEDNQEFYDADGDAEMEEAHVRNVTMSRPPIRAPRPLSLVQHPVLHHQYREDAHSPPPSSVFIIPPSPLTTTTFDAGGGTGSSTPTSATFADRMEEEGDLSNIGWPTTSVEHTLSPKRSYERIVAPRPQRVSRALEQVFTASTSSPVYRTPSLAQSPPPPVSPPSSSSSPRIPSASSPRWTFGSLKSALSNSMSHLVELARSRSPSPLPWLMRGSAAGSTSATLSGVAAALDSHRRDGLEEELESERSTSCVTPTPAAGSHSRRSSTTTITDVSPRRRAETSSSGAHLPVLKLQVDPTSADAMMSESPPPKRTLSTSSLSSLGSEPDSESGSSGGIFSRSPSPEPTSDTRIWDPSYTLTPRSRPISADAKAAAACGGRLSPMIIPGSWDPAELWAEEGDLAKTW